MQEEPYSPLPREWRQWGWFRKLAFWAVFFGMMIPINLMARAFARWLFP